jgi:hypothetical protein
MRPLFHVQVHNVESLWMRTAIKEGSIITIVIQLLIRLPFLFLHIACDINVIQFVIPILWGIRDSNLSPWHQDSFDMDVLQP